MTDDINDVRHTSTLGKFEESVRRSSLEGRLAELQAAQEKATGWGAAVGARHEEITDIERRLRAMDSRPSPDIVDDPTASQHWNAGCDFALAHLCKFLGVDFKAVSWDAATETVDGDVLAVIGNILRAKFGEDWGPDDAAATPSTTDLEKAELCERLSFPPEDARHIMVDKLLREYAAILRSRPLAQPSRNDVIEECARVLDACAQDWRRIRDPGMANNAAAYAKKIRALALSSTHQSAPVLNAPHNSGERLPSSDAAGAGADTKCPKCNGEGVVFECFDSSCKDPKDGCNDCVRPCECQLNRKD